MLTDIALQLCDAYVRIMSCVVNLVLRGAESRDAQVQVGVAALDVILQCLQRCALAAEHALQVGDSAVCVVCVAVELVLELSLSDKALLKAASDALQFCERSVKVA